MARIEGACRFACRRCNPCKRVTNRAMPVSRRASQLSGAHNRSATPLRKRVLFRITLVYSRTYVYIMYIHILVVFPPFAYSARKSRGGRGMLSTPIERNKSHLFLARDIAEENKMRASDTRDESQIRSRSVSPRILKEERRKEQKKKKRRAKNSARLYKIK